ncbi:hypothetical protein [Clostridium sp. AUH-JLR23]|uniref:hypothetical protein n=1 Tax=Clostridium sp. AUH-JLR23 TaxID=1505062 RepID=UPI0035664E4B
MVFAAEGGGSSIVSYLPGKSTGQNPDGSLADWTVDYPVKVVLNDSNISKETGQKMTFSLEDTNNPNNSYTGSSTVNLRVKNHDDIYSSNFRGRLQMRDNRNSLHNDVLMVIGLAQRFGNIDNIQFKANSTSNNYSENFGSLSSNNKTCVGYAYLYDKSGAVDGEGYYQTVTWNFSSN